MIMDWASTRQRYAGFAFFWQDLDGAHLAELPDARPPTSILWGTSGDRLVRLRVDEDTVYAAEAAARELESSRQVTQPWAEGWGPVAQFRSADETSRTRAFEMFVRRSDSGTPVTFVRPIPTS